jgi:hypothetical protein
MRHALNSKVSYSALYVVRMRGETMSSLHAQVYASLLRLNCLVDTHVS